MELFTDWKWRNIVTKSHHCSPKLTHQRNRSSSILIQMYTPITPIINVFNCYFSIIRNSRLRSTSANIFQVVQLRQFNKNSQIKIPDIPKRSRYVINYHACKTRPCLSSTFRRRALAILVQLSYQRAAYFNLSTRRRCRCGTLRPYNFSCSYGQVWRRVDDCIEYSVRGEDFSWGGRRLATSFDSLWNTGK